MNSEHDGQEFLSRFKKQSANRILLLVIDGLGGLRHPDFGNQSELQYAHLPNLDQFASMDDTVLGVLYPVARGFVPGSAAGHLGLLGYDPLLPKYQIGRGILEALDLELKTPIKTGDVVARINFATMSNGVIVDRRAGRISNASPLAEVLNRELRLSGVTAQVISTKEHRGILLLRSISRQLGWRVTDTDPGTDGAPTRPCKAVDDGDPAARNTAETVNSLVLQASKILKNEKVANTILIRGFSHMPDVKSLSELHGLECSAIADYPLYRGIAKLLGMHVLPPVSCLKAKVEQLRECCDSTSKFIFMHYKTPDSRGEDRDFLGKVAALEELDHIVPEIMNTMDLQKDVIVITGDHSTPSVLGRHSHHSVPLAIFSRLNRGFGEAPRAFDERSCLRGTFGRIRAADLMASLLARAEKLTKFDL